MKRSYLAFVAAAAVIGGGFLFAAAVVVAGSTVSSALAEDITSRMPRVMGGQLVKTLPAPPPPPSPRLPEPKPGFSPGVQVTPQTPHGPLPPQTVPGVTYRRNF
jgi:hypothetical protein